MYIYIYIYIYCPSRRQRVPQEPMEFHGSPREAPWRPQEATETSSRPQVLARAQESSRVTRPLGPLKVRLFEGVRADHFAH